MFYLLNRQCAGESVAWLPYTAFLIPAAAALRLAKFNLDTRDGDVFYGLPTPSAALFMFGLLWMQVESHPWLGTLCQSQWLYILVLLLPLLMLSNIRLWSLKRLGVKPGYMILTVFMVVCALLIQLTGAAGVCLIVIFYILFGILNYALKIY
jgi:CDP-diacylglycerol--serine O-phosphatidyltransferase